MSLSNVSQRSDTEKEILNSNESSQLIDGGNIGDRDDGSDRDDIDDEGDDNEVDKNLQSMNQVEASNSNEEEEDDDEDGYSDNDAQQSVGSADSSHVAIDLSENEIYKGICTLFEDQEGNNILEYISLLHSESIGLNKTMKAIKKDLGRIADCAEVIARKK